MAEMCVWGGWEEATSDGGVSRKHQQRRKWWKEWLKARQQDWVEDGSSFSSSGIKGD